MKFKDLITLKSLLPALEDPLEDECNSKSKHLHCFKGGDSRANEQPGKFHWQSKLNLKISLTN